MSTIKHSPMYLSKRLRERMDAFGLQKPIVITETTKSGYDARFLGLFEDAEADRRAGLETGADTEYGPEALAAIEHGEPSPRSDLHEALSQGMSASLFDEPVPLSDFYNNPAWPDLSERFTPTMAGLPEPEPERAMWRHPIALAACLGIYSGLLFLGLWWLSGL